MEISGHTRLYCVIGSPIAHSGSPAIYNYGFNELGLDCAYLAFEIKEEETYDAFKAFRLLNVGGINVTMPCKNAAYACCDEVSEAARMAGAVNTVVNVDGRFIGYNTDGLGFVRSLRENGIEVTGAKMTITGSGGAATSVIINSALEGMREISVFVHSAFDDAHSTAQKIREHVPDCTVNIFDLADKDALYEEIMSSDILANGTKAGMKPMDDVSPIGDVDAFHEGLVVYDMVYNPRVTKLLADAALHGCRTIGGVDMLVWQGDVAFQLYTGKRLDVPAIKERYFS